MSDEVKLLPCEFRIKVCWDAKASIWWVKSCNVPGINLEDDDPWKLIMRAAKVAPELIDLNTRAIEATRPTEQGC